MGDQPTILFVEHVLWQPGEDWAEALEHLAGRFARVSPLALEAVRGAGALHAQLEQLAAWGDTAGVDLDRELGRWFDEHLSMHLRPDPTVTRAVRALAAGAPVHAASALPPRVAEGITRHAGCWRSINRLHAPIRDAAGLQRLLEELPGAAVVAVDPTPMPPGVERRGLAAPIA